MKGRMTYVVLAFVILVFAGGPAFAQNGHSNGSAVPAATRTAVSIVVVTDSTFDSIDGRTLYLVYCASCHGLRGAGDGPAAPAMEKPPASLALLASAHQGKISRADVEECIRGIHRANPDSPEDGMPQWAAVFNQNQGGVAVLRLKNLTDYVQTLCIK